jgi:hypothetical protein
MHILLKKHQEEKNQGVASILVYKNNVTLAELSKTKLPIGLVNTDPLTVYCHFKTILELITCLIAFGLRGECFSSQNFPSFVLLESILLDKEACFVVEDRVFSNATFFVYEKIVEFLS